MSVKEIAERVATDCDDGRGGRESTSLTAMRIEAAIREAAKPLVEALKVAVSECRDLHPDHPSMNEMQAALAAWKEEG